MNVRKRSNITLCRPQDTLPSLHALLLDVSELLLVLSHRSNLQTGALVSSLERRLQIGCSEGWLETICSFVYFFSDDVLYQKAHIDRYRSIDSPRHAECAQQVDDLRRLRTTLDLTRHTPADAQWRDE